MAATGKTRGPRTPAERAGDAARSAATLFEKLPPSPYAEEILKPLAVLLRFDHSTSAYLDQEQTEAAAGAYCNVVNKWSSVEELEASHRRHFAGEALRELNRRLDAALGRLEGLFEVDRPRPTLALVRDDDDG